MRKLILLLSLLFISNGIWAQSAISVFSQQGDAFYIVVNGEKRNNTAQTNVRINGFKTGILYHIKLIFEDSLLPDVDKKFSFNDDNKLMSWVVKKKMRHGKLKKIKLKYNGMTEIPSEYSAKGNTNDSTASTTTHKVHQITISNDSRGVQTTTTTVTRTETTTQSENNVQILNQDNNSGRPVIMPGYTGSKGCNSTLVNQEEVKKALDKESFSNEQMTVLKQATKNRCVTTEQVIEFIEVFSFESDQLKAAQYLYGRTYDIDNFYKVNSVFNFSDSKEKLNEYIENQEN